MTFGRLALFLTLAASTAAALSAEATVRLGVMGLLRPPRVMVVLPPGCRLEPAGLLKGGGPDATRPIRLTLVREARGVRVTGAGVTGAVLPAVLLDPGEAGIAFSLDNGFRRVYRGRATITPARAEGRLQVVIERPVDAYLAGVLQAETRGNVPVEALRALAVTASAYVRWRRSPHAAEGFDLCDSTHCMFYAGEEGLSPVVGEAARFGASQALSLEKEGLAPVFTPCCGGECLPPAWVWPDDAAVLRSDRPVVCPWCRKSPDFTWRLDVPFDRLSQMVDEAFGTGRLSDIRVTFTERGGNRVVLNGSRRVLAVPPEQFRIELGRRFGWDKIRSNRFSLSRRGQVLRFDGRGFGHGAGLCVAGAAEMARRGGDWRRILGFYFPAAGIVQRVPDAR